MKSKTESLLGVVALIIIMILIFLLWRSCSRPDPVSADRRMIDSLLVEHIQKDWQFKHFKDSINTRIRRADSANQALGDMLVRAKNDARKSSRIASEYARRYDSAKIALDTSAMLASCDSLRWALATIQDATDTLIARTNQVVDGLHETIRLQSVKIQGMERRITEQDSALVKSYQIGKQLDDKVVKLERKVRNERRKGNGKLIAGAAVGAFIRGLFK